VNAESIRRQPLVTLALLASAAAIATAGYLIFRTAEDVRRHEIQLTQRWQERDWLAAQSPALSETNTSALGADVTAAEENSAALRQALAGRERRLESAPGRPLDAYFAIAATVERLRALAIRQQVALRPDERFEFASYVNEGPETNVLPGVHLQRFVIDHLVTSLLEARPRALLSVQRERPVPSSERIARQMPGTSVEATAVSRIGGVTADFFTPAAQLRLRSPGLIDTEAFRIEFSGQTQTLRTFLNEIAGFRLPLVVRSVEVEPLAAGADGAGAGEPGAAVPLVVQSVSKFAVVVEFVEVLVAPAPGSS
jgi:hypothetical protein